MIAAVLLALALLAPAAALADAGGAGAPAPGGPVRRFAVIAGNNEGGEGTRPLRYAERDASRIHDALTRLGGLAPADVRLLLGAGAEDLAESLAATERGVVAARAQGQRAELFVYYSGHAKDGDLRLGSTALPLASLKARLAASGADIRIAFLDACRSGAITRTKGARRAPAFDVDPGPAAARGLVILTSSSNDEESQESDELQGSFFTHALVSGMLGEADASRDGKVTLAEAYAYAYDRTVDGTLGTSAGPQHPTFSFDLAGQGDVVLTALRTASSWLVLPPALEGTFVVVEEESRQVAAESRKPAGVERRVALAPGAYIVKTRVADRLRLADVTVPASGGVALDPASLRDVDLSDDPVKGALAHLLVPERRVGLSLTGGFQTFLSAPSRELYFPTVGLVGVDLELRNHLREGWLLGADFALGSTRGDLAVDGRTFAYEFSQATLGLTVAAEFRQGARLRPLLGARLGLVTMSRRFPDEPALGEQGLLTTAPGLVAGVSWAAVGPLALSARVRTSWLVYSADENRSLGFLDASLGARLEF